MADELEQLVLAAYRDHKEQLDIEEKIDQFSNDFFIEEGIVSALENILYRAGVLDA